NFQKTLALNGDVKAVAGIVEVALGVDALSGDGANTATNLQTRRQLVGRTHLSARLPDGLVHEVFKDRTGALETCRADVGQVVRDHIQAGLLSFQPGFADPEGAYHFLFPIWPHRAGSS